MTVSRSTHLADGAVTDQALFSDAVGADLLTVLAQGQPVVVLN
jgi:hypothetical protein